MTKIDLMTAPLPDTAALDARKDQARAWFEHDAEDAFAFLVARGLVEHVADGGFRLA